MTLQAECPRCATAVDEQGGSWVCPLHGPTAPLWRAAAADYGTLVAHLDMAGPMPSWLPWPLPAGWTVGEFGAVRPEGPAASATFMTCGGLTETDGPVVLTVVTEEPGVGLGSRVAGVVHDDPGAHTQDRPVQTRVRVGEATVALWLVSTADEDAVGGRGDVTGDLWDRAVLVGESRGRWLWLVASPASAALGLDGWGAFEDLGSRGPELVDLEFAHRRGDW